MMLLSVKIKRKQFPNRTNQLELTSTFMFTSFRKASLYEVTSSLEQLVCGSYLDLTALSQPEAGRAYVIQVVSCV